MKPSVTTTSTVRRRAGRGPRRCRRSRSRARSLSRRCASTTSSRPLPASSPTVSRPTRRVLDLEHRGAEGGAEEGELDQVLGADLDVGADVEEEDRFAGDRQLHREGRALHALEAAQAEGRGRHRRPGRAAADHRVGAALGDVAGGAHDRGLLLRADRRHRVLVVADPLGGLDHLDPARRRRGRARAAGPKTRTPIPSAAASRAPSASTSKPCSAP